MQKRKKKNTYTLEQSFVPKNMKPHPQATPHKLKDINLLGFWNLMNLWLERSVFGVEIC